jgi:hypothetical protein
MDDLAQFSPRRRPLQQGDKAPAEQPLTSPIVFTIVPRIPLDRRDTDPHAWRRRLD